MFRLHVLPALLIGAALGATASSGAAFAELGGTSAQGHPFVSGGISEGGREALQERMGGADLWIVTAARGTGAYLADVRVAVTDNNGTRVIDTKLDGPWLIAELDPGRYTVTADFGAQHLVKEMTIGRGNLRRTYFYFEADAGPMPLFGER